MGVDVTDTHTFAFIVVRVRGEWDFVESRPALNLVDDLLVDMGVVTRDESAPPSLIPVDDGTPIKIEDEYTEQQTYEWSSKNDAEVPPYAAVDFEAARWFHALDRAGCDDLAKETFFLLASLPSDEAKYHANSIVSYLLCKKVQGPSRLVHKWACDCRRKVTGKLDGKFGNVRGDDDDAGWWNKGSNWHKRKRGN